jgi:ParB family chromosome partitioning protein
MSKIDELRRAAGANVDDSMGVNRQRRPVEMMASAPARWQGVAKSKNAAEIPVEKIDRDPDQPREAFDEEGLDRLAESMRTRGQLQPIRVRWDEGRGIYAIICGERRWRAARRAGLTTMTAIVVDEPIDPAELLSIQLIENALREDLKPMEQARAFRALMDRNGWSARQVARELAYPQSSLVKVLELLDLPLPVQERVERGELPVTTAYELRMIEDPVEQVSVADRAVAEDLTREQVKEIVDRRPSPSAGAGKGRGAGKGGPPKPKIFRTAAGKLTIDPKRTAAGDWIESALLDALAQHREARGRSEEAAA